MTVIKHIWRYLTDKNYRHRMTLLGENRKRVKLRKKKFDDERGNIQILKEPY